MVESGVERKVVERVKSCLADLEDYELALIPRVTIKNSERRELIIRGGRILRDKTWPKTAAQVELRTNTLVVYHASRHSQQMLLIYLKHESGHFLHSSIMSLIHQDAEVRALVLQFMAGILETLGSTQYAVKSMEKSCTFQMIRAAAANSNAEFFANAGLGEEFAEVHSATLTPELFAKITTPEMVEAYNKLVQKVKSNMTTKQRELFKCLAERRIMPCWDNKKRAVDFEPHLNRRVREHFKQVLQLYTKEDVGRVRTELSAR